MKQVCGIAVKTVRVIIGSVALQEGQFTVITGITSNIEGKLQV